MENDTYYLVNASILPSTVGGVILAKELLNSGKAESVSEAVKMAGVSRSAYYKYRDVVFKYEKGDPNTVQLKAFLEDRAGVFSAVTDMLSKNGANILTINQSAPSDGIATAVLTVKTDGLNITLDELIEKLKTVNGVIKIGADNKRG